MTLRRLKKTFESYPGVERVFPVSALAAMSGTDAPQTVVRCRTPPGGPDACTRRTTISRAPRALLHRGDHPREDLPAVRSRRSPTARRSGCLSHKERDGVKKDLDHSPRCSSSASRRWASSSGAKAGRRSRSCPPPREAGHREVLRSRPVYLDLGVKVREGWRSRRTPRSRIFGLDDPNRLEAAQPRARAGRRRVSAMRCDAMRFDLVFFRSDFLLLITRVRRYGITPASSSSSSSLACNAAPPSPDSLSSTRGTASSRTEARSSARSSLSADA